MSSARVGCTRRQALRGTEKCESTLRLRARVAARSTVRRSYVGVIWNAPWGITYICVCWYLKKHILLSPNKGSFWNTHDSVRVSDVCFYVLAKVTPAVRRPKETNSIKWWIGDGRTHNTPHTQTHDSKHHVYSTGVLKNQCNYVFKCFLTMLQGDGVV